MIKDVDKFSQFWSRLKSLLSQKNVFFNASAITFNLIICAIPFTLIMVSIIGYVLSYETAYQEITNYATELLPRITDAEEDSTVIFGRENVTSILDPIIGARTVFGVTGLLVLIVFTQGLISVFKQVLFDIFDITERKHPVIDVIYNFLGFGVLGSVFLFFSLFLSLITLFDLSVIHVPYTDIYIKLPWIYDLLDFILPIILMFALIYVVFRFLSERKISTKTALFGASVYSILFEIAKVGLSYYMGYAFSTYKYYYKGYALFILMGFWVFYISLLFVISVIITRAFKEAYLTDSSIVTENPYTAID